MREYLVACLPAAGLPLCGASRAAYVPIGAIAGVDSPSPAAPVPTAADLAFATGHVPFGSVVGNPTNGCGLYDGGVELLARVSARGRESTRDTMTETALENGDIVELEGWIHCSAWW